MVSRRTIRRARVAIREPDQVVAGRAGERVDRLVLVADDREVATAAQPCVEQCGLERVRVLELVDREPAVAVTDLVGDGRVGLDQPDRQLEHVLEVDPAGAALAVLVVAIEPGHQVGRERRVAVLGDGARLVGGRDDASCLRPLDLTREVADGEIAIATGQAGRQGGEDRHLRVEDRWGIDAVDARPEMAELTQGRGMERGRRHAGMPQRRQPAGHLGRGLVGERDDQHVAWPDHARGERIGHPTRDHPGLAAPCAGEDAQRPGCDRDSLPLVAVEIGQEVVGVMDRHLVIVAGTPAPPVIG